MDNHHIHIDFHADDLAVPEVVVEEEETEETAGQTENLPDGKNEQEDKKASEEAAAKQEYKAEDAADEKPGDGAEDAAAIKPHHKKITPHIHYDTLAVPEITFDIEEE